MKKAFNVNSVDIKADCESGAWLHLKDPYDPSKDCYADDKGKYPVRVKVKGARSDAMKAFNDEVKRIRNEEGYETSEERDAEVVAGIIMDWENIEVDGSQAFSKESAIILCRKIPEFKVQIIAFAMQLKNFKGSASKG